MQSRQSPASATLLMHAQRSAVRKQRAMSRTMSLTTLTAHMLLFSGGGYVHCIRMPRVPCNHSSGTRTGRPFAAAWLPFSSWQMTAAMPCADQHIRVGRRNCAPFLSRSLAWCTKMHKDTTEYNWMIVHRKKRIVKTHSPGHRIYIPCMSSSARDMIVCAMAHAYSQLSHSNTLQQSTSTCC